VLIIYAAIQRTHRPPHVVKQGQHCPSFDVPERIDSILDAINARELEPVMGPADVGLEPIHAVHDGGMIEYLATAYERQRTEANVSTPVFPTFFPPPGQRRRPDCSKG
jgi:acetoin utilization deacetylase AcuC-like enzyme